MTGKVALVTGASRGIGQAVALDLAGQGCSVAVHYGNNVTAAQETVAKITALGAECELFPADVADFGAVAALMKAVIERFGRIDILVNNAGVLKRGFLMMASEKDFREVIDTNLCGVFHCIKAAGPQMIKQRSGVIVNMSSLASSNALVGQGAYAASKAAIESLTRTAAKEFVSFGVRVNSVSPGCVDTGMMNTLEDRQRQDLVSVIPMKRFGAVSEIAQCVRFLASDEASYITGQTLVVDGGMTLH